MWPEDFAAPHSTRLGFFFSICSLVTEGRIYWDEGCDLPIEEVWNRDMSPFNVGRIRFLSCWVRRLKPVSHRQEKSATFLLFFFTFLSILSVQILYCHISQYTQFVSIILLKYMNTERKKGQRHRNRKIQRRQQPCLTTSNIANKNPSQRSAEVFNTIMISCQHVFFNIISFLT